MADLASEKPPHIPLGAPPYHWPIGSGASTRVVAWKLTNMFLDYPILWHLMATLLWVSGSIGFHFIHHLRS